MAAPPYVAVIGASGPSDAEYEMARAVGRGLAEGGAFVVSGGRGGVMAAECQGASSVGGAYWILSEIALALQAGKPVLGLGTWDIEGIEPQPDPQTAVARALELARRPPT